jgi:AraC-like DNA-binding protein/quercetin dioxygenase-like cupin family protein
MALQKCGLNLDNYRRELQPHGTPAFPCAAFSLKCTDCLDDEIPWHWHEEVEVIYIEDGKLSLHVPGATICIKKGESLFINSRILHRAIADNYCELHSLVFHPLLIMGKDNSIFAQRYIDPLMHCRALDYCLFDSGCQGKQEIIDYIRNAFEAMATDELGYEFIVRENLSHICLCLFQQYAVIISENPVMSDIDSIRIKKMIDYIHDHYTERLELAQIAKTAGIGKRECLRCFQRMIQISPLQYLIKYRVTKGASMLLDDKTCSVSDVSIRCGFDSPSNFTQTFKRFFMCSPREYRKND